MTYVLPATFFVYVIAALLFCHRNGIVSKLYTMMYTGQAVCLLLSGVALGYYPTIVVVGSTVSITWLAAIWTSNHWINTTIKWFLIAMTMLHVALLVALLT